MDFNAWTPCDQCGTGQYTADSELQVFMLYNATACWDCPPGSFDHDSSSSLPELSSAYTPCEDCPAGKMNERGSSADASDCVDCDAGRWSNPGSSACAGCLRGSYRGLTDDGCVDCDIDAGEYCERTGLAFPLAAAGFYADVYVSSATNMNATKLVVCLPWQACLGSCPESVQVAVLNDIEAVNTFVGKDDCLGSLGVEACSPGYTGIRCSLCEAFDDERDGCEEVEGMLVPNGFYRMNQRCEPCPCTVMTFEVIVVMAILALFAVFFILDSFSAESSEHASVMVGPGIILLTFCQTVSLSLDIDIPWPPFLRQCIQWLDSFNFDLEFGRPECTITYGPVEKMYMVAMTPVIVFGTLFAYTIFKWIDILPGPEPQEAHKEPHRRAASRDRRHLPLPQVDFRRGHVLRRFFDHVCAQCAASVPLHY